MGRVRVVGRRRSEERCVICHGALRDQPLVCPGCKATMHADCRAGMPRCPTLGCAASSQAAAVAQPASRDPPTGRRRRPTFAQRFGPYSRLVLSGALTAVALVACAALLAWPIASWRSYSSWAFMDEGVRAPVQGVLLTALVLLAGSLGAYFSLSWLLRLPGVFLEVRHLLDNTQPIPMRLTIVVTGSGSDEKRTAALSGGGHQLELGLGGVLPAGWVQRMPAGTRVYVYGLPPPGPYLIEVPDGRLALFHPD